MSQAGRMRERITIVNKELTPDEGWNDVVSEHEQYDIWARVEPVAGNERLKAQQIQASTEYLITTRMPTDENCIKPTTVLRWRGKDLAIVSVLPNERRTELKIQAKNVDDSSIERVA